MTYIERFTEARAAYYARKDEVDSFIEREIADAYARMRAEDKAAGRDTGRGSVARRKQIAYDSVITRDDVRAMRAECEALWAAYKAIATPS